MGQVGCIWSDVPDGIGAGDRGVADNSAAVVAVAVGVDDAVAVGLAAVVADVGTPVPGIPCTAGLHELPDIAAREPADAERTWLVRESSAQSLEHRHLAAVDGAVAGRSIAVRVMPGDSDHRGKPGKPLRWVSIRSCATG